MEKKQEINNQLKLLLSSVMPSYNIDYWQDSTELFGALPEFDSMAIVTLLTELEEHLDIEFDDDAQMKKVVFYGKTTGGDFVPLLVETDGSIK